MAIVLHNLKPAAAAGAYHLDVAVDDVRSDFPANVCSDGTGAACDEKLFFLLSERALAERGSSAQYHADLVLLLIDVHRGLVTKLPFVFGIDRRFPGGSSYRRRSWWHRVLFGWRPAEAQKRWAQKR